MRRIILLMSTCLVWQHALALHFEASISDANWTVASSPFSCRISQTIPALGQAEFYHDAGDDLRFTLRADSELPIQQNIALSLIPPAWNTHLRGDVLSTFDRIQAQHLSLGNELSEKVMRGLLFGFSVELSQYQARAKNDSVTISPVRFREAYRNFQTCMTSLLPKNFEQISHSKIQFALGQDMLTETDRRTLRDIARYTQADAEVNAVYVDGYTDDVGKRADNLELSRKRAEQVALYLIQQGVNPDIVALRYHGDFYPLAANNSAANRAKNRRVTVRLDKIPSASIRDKLYNAITLREASKPVDAAP